jgi:hypothetical protein
LHERMDGMVRHVGVGCMDGIVRRVGVDRRSTRARTAGCPMTRSPPRLAPTPTPPLPPLRAAQLFERPSHNVVAAATAAAMAAARGKLSWRAAPGGGIEMLLRCIGKHNGLSHMLDALIEHLVRPASRPACREFAQMVSTGTHDMRRPPVRGADEVKLA